MNIFPFLCLFIELLNIRSIFEDSCELNIKITVQSPKIILDGIIKATNQLSKNIINNIYK